MHFLKKTFLVGGLLVAATSINAANLTTVNNTDLPSTVKVTSGVMSGACATSFDSSSYTPAHATHESPWSKVKALCGLFFSTCTADVYVGKNHDCTGKKIGEATLHSSGDVDAKTTDPAYEIIASKYHVVLNQK